MDKKTQGTTMNYQIVPFWIYSGRVAFFILLAVLTGFWGMNAFCFICYFTELSGNWWFLSVYIH
ncbi:Uncharacterised protein [Morganella morganii]|nr:Uncharacterised protein [Morganella morganii]